MSQQLLQLLTHVKKVGAAFDKGRKSNAKQASYFPSTENVSFVPISPLKDTLPVELQIQIFAHCRIQDLLQLKLVCRAFHQILSVHERQISRRYLRLRRHGTLPSPIHSEKTYTRNPEDDVVLLSDLFMPASSVKGGHLYTFRYILSLRRRQKLCSRLCYYLADRVMDRLLHSEPAFIKANFPTKSERNALVKRGIASLWFNLTPLMYYVLYFLETYCSARREQTNTLLRDFETRQLPFPIPLNKRKTMNKALQLEIIQSPPFTDTSTLISTHHCMQLLVSYLCHTVPPDESIVPDNSWIHSLLTISPFIRVVEYFSAEIGDGGNQRLQRKEFMQNFHNDLRGSEKDEVSSLIFENPVGGHQHSSINDVWFDAAKQELARRNALPHDMEPMWICNGIPILFGCPDCNDSVGWHA
ncbi:hypothetical protein ASPZODRAFT_135231 [Penicilliopsis zonata CBS 506.65]|uniref:F-box domain-containing protein n=1 Tax=Penicilliopsis zonata CBS 506.65 TaxID=1073090 RepID=A0A1L9SB75_9EURO|nr:hypothetical protein ASPZODRAFT_135231 [Penicilliopsis zonata CBS 506.65]OJJ44408.1 hypothetical protein ASPZODRAFT_135231 [Penicilliopsis zonata CBS 506.65]